MLETNVITSDLHYDAHDVYLDLAGFLNQLIELFRLKGRAHASDILGSDHKLNADVALLLKALPCLEQSDKGRTEQLLDTINAPILIVSYPVQSLGGRERGMRQHYPRRLQEIAQAKAWRVEQINFDRELIFRV